MKGIKKKADIFATAYKKYKDIEDMNDLRKEKLTLDEYDTVFDLLKQMSDLKSKGYTFKTGVAEWFRRNKIHRHDGQQQCKLHYFVTQLKTLNIIQNILAQQKRM